MKIDWKHKLSSRKFWAGAAAYATGILTAFGAENNTVVQVTSVLGGIGALIVYMLAEAYVDGKKTPPQEDDENGH